MFLFALVILTAFYTLDCLYAERKDKSILFWRSLPITDAETVVSKLLTAIVVLPLVTVATIIVTHLVNLVITTVWVMVKGGNAAHLVWGSVPLFDNWAAALIVTLASAVWMSPLIGWFLFVSAFTKRSPLLMAFMPLIIIPIMLSSIIGTVVATKLNPDSIDTVDFTREGIDIHEGMEMAIMKSIPSLRSSTRGMT